MFPRGSLIAVEITWATEGKARVTPHVFGCEDDRVADLLTTVSRSVRNWRGLLWFRQQRPWCGRSADGQIVLEIARPLVAVAAPKPAVAANCTEPGRLTQRQRHHRLGSARWPSMILDCAFGSWDHRIAAG